MALDEPDKNESPIVINGLDVLVSNEVKSYVEKSTIDYISGPHGEGFTIGIAGSSGCC